MIFFILVIALLLRLILIDQSFWLDEASQAMTSLRPLHEIVFQNLGDFHPPLSYILSHFWILFGRGEVWLRLLPVLFGVGTVYLLYILGKELFGQKVGLLAGLLLSIAPYHIYYSQEFRMYSMATFFAVWSMCCLVKILGEGREGKEGIEEIEETEGIAGTKGTKGTEGNKGFFGGVGFVLSSVLLLYTHYLGGLLFISQVSYLVFLRRDLLFRMIKQYLVVGLFFLPWIPFLYSQLQLGLRADSVLPGWSSMLTLGYYKAIPLLFTKFIIGRIDFDNSLVYLFVIGISFLVVGLGLYPLVQKIKDKRIVLLLFWFWVPVLLTFIISFKVPMFQPFRLLFVLPSFLLLLSVGILSFKKYQQIILRITVFLFLIFQGVFLVHSGYWREDWKGAVRAADEFVKDRGVVLFAWKEPFPPYQFYSEKQVGGGGLMPDVGERMITGQIGSRVVYFSYLGQLTDPERKTEKLLEDYGYKEVEVRDFRGVGFLHFYVSRENTLGLK